jgi:hypothetical protein
VLKSEYRRKYEGLQQSGSVQNAPQQQTSSTAVSTKSVQQMSNEELVALARQGG